VETNRAGLRASTERGYRLGSLHDLLDRSHQTRLTRYESTGITLLEPLGRPLVALTTAGWLEPDT
jgi:hypothetical protein